MIMKNNVEDSQHFKEMFKTLRNEIKTVDIIAEHGIKPLIKCIKIPHLSQKWLLHEEKPLSNPLSSRKFFPG